MKIAQRMIVNKPIFAIVLSILLMSCLQQNEIKDYFYQSKGGEIVFLNTDTILLYPSGFLSEVSFKLEEDNILSVERCDFYCESFFNMEIKDPGVLNKIGSLDLGKDVKIKWNDSVNKPPSSYTQKAIFPISKIEIDYFYNDRLTHQKIISDPICRALKYMIYN